jgi:hypothetical protein
MTRLLSLEKQLTEKMKGSNLAAYATFREMQADYSVKIAGSPDFTKTQTEWLGRLAKFIETYPQAEDTPDAMLQAGMVCEFLGKDVEAKNWYAQLKKAFPDKPQGVKGAGAIRRLELEGQTLKLAGPTLADPNVVYDAEQAHGKLIVVYYWAGWNSNSVGDFAKLKLLLDSYGSKGVELVCVNLDNTAEEAKSFLQRSPAPGTHLYQAGGMEGKLGTEYGILMTPHLFLAGKDGKVLSRNLQISGLEDEIKKQLK